MQAASLKQSPQTNLNILQGDSRNDPGAKDYMSIGYELNQEPLLLSARGQSWFESIYNFYSNETSNSALVLGGVAWMASILAKSCKEINVIDHSSTMLENVWLNASETARSKLILTHSEWQDLSFPRQKLDVVLGDNSFTYMKFPLCWQQLSNIVADNMNQNGLLFLRSFSVPEDHVKQSVEEIVGHYRNQESINFTEVRTRLLFSQWDSVSYDIFPEQVLDYFIRNQDVFKCLMDGLPPGANNDLETMSKYRNSNLVYAAPPLLEKIKVLKERFDILGIHFGPYQMNEYFPLVVARRR
jgi:hypothetical protein